MKDSFLGNLKQNKMNKTKAKSNEKTNKQKLSNSWEWWHSLVILALWETEARGPLLLQGQPGLHSKTLFSVVLTVVKRSGKAHSLFRQKH